ncbi:MAG: glycosyltransferase family 4 protein [Bacilli bacterium]|jgi:glycosyltransferase involved in cell wall biosynthesis|nr:glycosyltransferase family 4 protein [Bacilli bacterium]
MKTITFLLMYYKPENHTINYVYNPIINDYIKQGYRVNIIVPNPTRGLSRAKIKEYQNKAEEKIDENLLLYRVNCFTYKRYNKFNLLLRYLSVSSRCARKLKKIKSDIVFLQTSPPIFYAYKASKIAKKKNISIVYNVQDIYPDNIFKENKLLYKIIDHYQKKTLNNADVITTLSDDMKNTLLKKGEFKNKIKIIPNPVTFKVDQYNKQLLEKVSIDYSFKKDKINVVYAGNMGYLQDMDVIISAAKKVLEKTNKYNFILIGEGAQKERLNKEVKSLNNENIKIYNMAPMELSPYIYKLADYNVISLLPNVIYTACPLKTAMIIEADKKVIACVDKDSEYVKELNEKVKELIVISNRNAEKLAKELIKRLKSNEE